MFDFDDLPDIAGAQAGKSEAFDPLVRRYHDGVYRHIHRRVKDAEVAKNLTQETWLKAYRSIQTYRGDSAFSSWLYRIAENVCLDDFRRQKHRDTDPLHLIAETRITDTDKCPSHGWNAPSFAER